MDSKNLLENEKDLVDVKLGVISLEELVTWAGDPTAGAISTFLGTTRNNFNGRKVTRLEYEAYIPMAIKEMQKICKAIREKWEVIKIAMIHRIGLVPIGESSIVIVISSAHRRESLEAVEFAIDEVKAKVPVWKKEFYEDDNSGKWKANSECCFPHTHHHNKQIDSATDFH